MGETRGAKPKLDVDGPGGQTFEEAKAAHLRRAGGGRMVWCPAPSCNIACHICGGLGMVGIEAARRYREGSGA